MGLSPGEERLVKGLKAVEWLKAELAAGVGGVLKALYKGSEDLIADALAHVVLTSYLLARRVGVGFSRLDLRVDEQLRHHVGEGHELESWYGDLSALQRYRRNPGKEQSDAVISD